MMGLNFFLRSLLLCLILLAQLTTGRAQGVNQSVTCRDPRIRYDGVWVDQDGGGHKYTGTAGSSFAFTFQGSAIYWYTANEPRGGVSSLQVDSDTAQVIDASSGTNINSSTVVAPLFIQTGLDDSVNHTLNLTFIGPGILGGPYATIYYLVFTSGGTSGAAPSATASNAAGPSSQTAHSDGSGTTSDVRHSQNIGAIVGGVVGGLVGLAIVGAVTWLCLLRVQRRRAKDMELQAATPFAQSRQLSERESVTVSRDSRYRASISKPTNVESNNTNTEGGRETSLLPRRSTPTSHDASGPTSVEHDTTPQTNSNSWNFLNQSDIMSLPPPEYQR